MRPGRAGDGAAQIKKVEGRRADFDALVCISHQAEKCRLVFTRDCTGRTAINSGVFTVFFSTNVDADSVL